MSWYLRLAIRRLTARWRSLLTMIIGVLLAAVIGANAPLYTSAILQVGMVQHLETYSAADVNIYLRTGITPVDVSDIGERWSEIDAVIDDATREAFAPYGEWLTLVEDWAETTSMTLMQGDAAVEGASGKLAYYQALDPQVELVAGELPSDVTGDVIPVAVSQTAATLLDATVGDQFTLAQQGWDTSVPIDVEVVGIVAPDDSGAAYWFEPSPLRVETGRNSEMNFLTTRANVERVAADNLPNPVLQVGWRLVFDHSTIAYSQLPDALNTVNNFESELRRTLESVLTAANGFVYITDLPAILAGYSADSSLLNIPFGLLIVQLGALVLFFLIVIAALVRRSERRETSMLQSRGALDRQVILFRAVEAFIICAIMAVIAPFVGRALLIVLIPLLTGIERLPLPLTPAVFGFSAGAAFLAFTILVATVLPVLQLPLISAGGSSVRSGTRTWWQRYYLDIVLLIVGLLALFQLTNNQSLAARTTDAGTTQADPLLLLAPTLLFVAFSSVLLRLFPAVMDVIARRMARSSGLVTALGSWQVSREPLHYGRIAFLLALAIGIGWFAIAYQSTLTGNQTDLATYQVGSDARVIIGDETNPQQLADDIAAMDGVQDVAVVNRIELRSMTVSSGTRGRQGRTPGTIIAADLPELPAASYWREDYATPEVDTLGQSGEISGRPMPDDTDSISIWLRMESPIVLGFSNMTPDAYPAPVELVEWAHVEARFETTSGQVFTLVMQPQDEALRAYIDSLPTATPQEESDEPVPTPDMTTYEPPHQDYPDNGWIEFTADLSEIRENAEGTLHFAGFSYNMPNLSPMQFSRFVAFGDLTFHGDGTDQTPDWLTDESLWELRLLRGANMERWDTAEYDREADQDFGREGILLVHRPEDEGFWVQLLLEPVEAATVEFTQVSIDEEDIIGIPALLSRGFAESNELEIDQRFKISFGGVAVWFRVDGIIDLFPTLYPDAPFMAVDQRTLARSVVQANDIQTTPTEIWVRLSDTVSSADFAEAARGELGAAVADVHTVDDVINSFEADILSLGVIGLLYLSFLIGLVLSVVSLFTYIGLSVQARISEFAVLRAMGLPNRKVVFIIIFEQLLVLITAVILGAIIGQFLTSQVLPPLALSAAGGQITPPFTVRLNVVLLGQYMLALLTVILLVLFVSYVWVRRSATVQALRLNEE